MKLDGLAFDENRLESLYAQAMEGRGAIEHDWVILGHVFKDVPNFGTHLVEHAARRLQGEALGFHQLPDDERLKKLQGHLLWKSALIELQVRPDDDDGTAGVIDALSKEILPEAALLSF